ncbi:MAG TPA: SIMPL domain-containing protein, partial [Candidatus Acidoferrum sp.]|nr:SIMPL domain-containing protein [Candidatus Acidoferrum sp.]
VAATALAQTDTNTITITASRNVSVAPDQAVYQVSVTTDSSAGLSDAAALVADAGIKAADLSYTSSYGTTVIWEFERVVPFSSMKDTNLTLAKLAKQVGSQPGVPSISYSVASVRTSQAAQSQACQFSALVSDARREAERVAAAAGVHVGAIVGLAEHPLPGNIVPTAVARVTYIRATADPTLGIPILVDPLLGLSGWFAPAPPPQPTPCRMVVQFRLLP